MKQRKVSELTRVGESAPELTFRPMKTFDLWSITERFNYFNKKYEKENAKNIKVVAVLEKNSSNLDKLTKTDEACVQEVAKPYLLLGQCYFLFPVYGVLSKDPNELMFSWKSPRVLCNLLVLAVYLFMASLQVLDSIKRGTLNFKAIDNIVGYGLYVVTLSLLLVQAKNWPTLIQHWSRVEQKMKHFPPITGLSLTVKFYVITFFIGTILLGASRLASNVAQLTRCSRDPVALAELTIVSKYLNVFRLTGYSRPAAAALTALFLHQNTVMVYDELTILVLPLCLAHRFRQLYRHMARRDGRKMPITYWAEMRETYNSLSLLAKSLEDQLTKLTFITIGSNLYFICTLLLSSLHHASSPWARYSIVYLLGFTIGRTFVAALAASSLHEQSRLPLSLLFSVPTDSYCTEVARFQMQVTHDEITITGCKFFALTRSFILTVAGTIVTYEIVLLQFGSDNETAETSTFKSSTCTLLKKILTHKM